MTFTPVKKFPMAKGRKGKEIVCGYFTEFIKLDIKAAKISFNEGEYCNTHSAYNSLHRAASKWEFPVRVSMRKDDIYFIRTDK